LARTFPALKYLIDCFISQFSRKCFILSLVITIMEIFIADTYNELSKQAANDVIQLMQSRKHPLICIASGDTPAGLYKEIVDKVNKNDLNISDWSFIGLDEWVGMNGDDEGSCRFNLNEQLFQPLKIAANKISFFDGRANDPDKECEGVEHFILQHGGIDVAILGLGMNGHIGMNEPGTSSALRSHVTDLDPITQKVGQKYFKQQQQLKEGITLGMATLMESRHIILLVSGAHKAEIVKKMIEGQITDELPGSLLRNHPALKIYLDEEAAGKISQS
jgi:glucosamine-6-phosphate isomerase